MIGFALGALTNTEHHSRHLSGILSGHPDPQIADGEAIVTSRVFEISDDVRTAWTRNACYTLGEADHRFVALAAESGMTVREFVGRIRL